MLTKEKAIILSKTKYGDADLILKILTVDGAVFSVLARSALKSKKRFGGGVLEPSHYIECSLSRRPDGINDSNSERMAILDDAHLIDEFKNLKTDYDRITLAMHFLKTISTVLREGDDHIEMFNLLGHSLKKAETTSNLHILKLQFHLKILHLQGVLPPQDHFAPLLRASIREGDKIEIESHSLSRINAEVAHLFNSYVGI